MKKLLSIGLVSLILPLFMMSPSFAAIDFIGDSCDGKTGGVCKDANPTGGREGAAAVIKNIVNALLYLIGAISVIMIVYGGFRYVSSAGDSNAVQSAKGVILYAVIGLAVALVAYAIVNFVVGVIW